MCIAADVPLIDGGTSGFNGSVGLIKKARLWSDYPQYLC
jgi:molybdopterin/thiamine biosynthesis adenylyltransferase